MFQDHVTLTQLPKWLAYDGFTSLIRESMGDVEAKFFVPGIGWQLEFVETKNHRLTAALFWAEIVRFQEMELSSDNSYRRFTLICTGLSAEILTVVNALRRVRDALPFHEAAPKITEQSYQDFQCLVERMGKSPEMANFMYRKVNIEWDWHPAQSHGEGLFREAALRAFPMYDDLSSRVLHEVYQRLYTFIRSRRNCPVWRHEIEDIFFPQPYTEPPAIRLHTVGRLSEPVEETALRLDWWRFFGGMERTYPSSSEWNEQVMGELNQTRDWIISHRGARQLYVTGSRRLSSTFAIGAVFSAVAGFILEMNHRGIAWRTDAHPSTDTPNFPLTVTLPSGPARQVVVVIGILRDIAAEVESYLKDAGLLDLPRLHLHSNTAVVSPQHANQAAGVIKQIIAKAVADIEATKIHLFYAGPSPLALYIGHRLNAIASVQCYEWMGAGKYAPTCLLITDP